MDFESFLLEATRKKLPSDPNEWSSEQHMKAVGIKLRKGSLDLKKPTDHYGESQFSSDRKGQPSKIAALHAHLKSHGWKESNDHEPHLPQAKVLRHPTHPTHRAVFWSGHTDHGVVFKGHELDDSK